MKQLNNKAPFPWLAVLFFAVVCILFAAGLFLLSVSNAGAAGYPPAGTYLLPYSVGGGDCSANNARADLYTPKDFYCETNPGKPQTAVEKAIEIVSTATPTNVVPTFEPTSKPPQVTPTLVPTLVPTDVPPTVVVPTNVPPTLEPTNVPPTVIVEPTNPPATEQPTEEPTQVPTEKPPKATKTPKPHCDKGEGNGGEDCDPGNNPDNGNDDED